MNQHLTICRDDESSRWMLIARDHAGKLHMLAGNGTLQNLLAGAIQTLASDPGSDLTFTTQGLSATFPLLERPEDLAGWAPGASITLMARERPEVDDLMNICQRFPTGGLSCRGKADRLRMPALGEALTKWLTEEDPRSFEPATAWSALHERQFRVVRPSFDRLLLVRRGDWYVRELCPQAFEDPAAEAQRLARLAATETEYARLREARDPRTKTRLAQQQAAEDHKLLDPSLPPAERAALEAAREQKARMSWRERALEVKP